MTKPKLPVSLGAAECARRTGLTIRALRVYERQGLIEPMRSAQGWRLYGPEEITRLNAVATLKSLGLSLAQIRSALTDSPPTLAGILQTQMENWQARKQAAEQGLRLVESALSRLEAHRSLSIDELCDLIKSIESNDLWQIVREQIRQHVTPEEEKAWLDWWAQRPKEGAKAGQAHLEAQRLIMSKLRKLKEKGAKPASAKVQQVIAEMNRNSTQHGIRQHLLDALEWNPSVTRKWFGIGNRIVRFPIGSETDNALVSFHRQAVKVAKWNQALQRLLEQARVLIERKQPIASVPAQALAGRFAEVCRRHCLGDPEILVRWMCSLGKLLPNQELDVDAKARAAWEYLGKAAGHRKRAAAC